MKTAKTKIEKIVKQQNAINQVATVNLPIIQELLQDYIGQKITKKDNYLLAKLSDNLQLIEPEITPLTSETNPNKHYAKCHRVYLDISEYSIWFKICINYNGGFYPHDNPEGYKTDPYYCDYIEESYYIGEMSGQELKSLNIDNCLKNIKRLDPVQVYAEYSKAYDAAKAYKKSLSAISCHKVRDIMNDDFKYIG